jgi:hypothetical protein
LTQAGPDVKETDTAYELDKIMNVIKSNELEIIMKVKKNNDKIINIST